MLRVIRNHAVPRMARATAEAAAIRRFRSTPLIARPAAGRRGARASGTRSAALGEKHGFATPSDGLAPTGTIGLVMDCDTTDEPDFALVSSAGLRRRLFQDHQPYGPRGAAHLGYDDRDRRSIERALGPRHCRGAARQSTRASPKRVRRTLRWSASKRCRRLRHRSPSTNGPWRRRLHRDRARRMARRPGFDLLTSLGFSRAGIGGRRTPIAAAR